MYHAHSAQNCSPLSSNNNFYIASQQNKQRINLLIFIIYFLLNYYRQSLNKTSRSDLKKILKSLCKNVQVGKSECLDWFDGHSDEIYNILNKLDPESACLQIGLCPKKIKNFDEETVMEKWNEYQSMFDDDDLFEIDVIPLPTPDNSNNGLSSIECTLCEEVINKVQKEIGQNKSTV